VKTLQLSAAPSGAPASNRCEYRPARTTGRPFSADPVLADLPVDRGAGEAARARATTDLDRLRRRRADLGLHADDDAPLLLDGEGRPIAEPDLATQLRLARTTRISIEGNAALCGGLLSVRYGVPDPAGAENGR
jgi:hypothetical protein